MTATLSASVLDPEGFLYWTSTLSPQARSRYVSEASLQLPLDPMPGDWRLVVKIQSDLEVEGARELVFRPDPIPFRDLAVGLPQTFDMHVPEAFVEVTARGDQIAGVREWRHGDGAIELWWAPGPTEPLLLNNAIVMLETTYGMNTSSKAFEVEELLLQDRPAFLFTEDGPAKVLVTQGPNNWLYVVRVRVIGGETIPSLLYQVWKTFTFIE